MGEGFVRIPGPDDEEDDFAADIEDEDAPKRAAEAAEAEERAEIEALDRAAEAGSARDAEARKLWDREQALLARMAQIADRARGRPGRKDPAPARLDPQATSARRCHRMDAPPSARPPRWNDRRVLIFTENREGTKRYLRKILEAAIAGHGPRRRTHRDD